MPRPIVSLRDKLRMHELKAIELIAARQNELMDIFKSCNAIAVDDNLLEGFLLFVMDENNQDSQILKDYIYLAKANKSSNKSRQSRRKRTTKTV